MVDEKAAAYAKEHASDGDIPKVYEAYKDGYGDKKRQEADLIVFFVVGILIGIAIVVFMHDHTDICEFKKFKP